MNCVWSESEIKDLMLTVEECKTKNKSLLTAFEKHAKNYNRMPLSVRNFYYKNADEICKNENLQKKLNINIDLHQKNIVTKFNERQTKILIDYINQKIKNGQSVRSACNELANNDAKMLIRFQNKFIFEQRKFQKEKNDKQKVNGNVEKFKNDTKENNTYANDKIISFPSKKAVKQQVLTDSEMQSLFLGLIRLVKNSIKIQMEENIQKEKRELSMQIIKSNIEIGEKNTKIENLEKENNFLCKELILLKQKIERLRVKYISKEKNNND